MAKKKLSEMSQKELLAHIENQAQKKADNQRKRRERKKLAGMKEVCAWIRDVPEVDRENFTPVLVWIPRADVASYKRAMEDEGGIPYIQRQPSGVAALAWSGRKPC